jgi:hypothetical protein
VTTDDDGVRIHPIYNQNPAFSDQEREFVERYGIDYILANPNYAPIVRTKMAESVERFQLVYERDGFLLYKATRKTAEHATESALP